LSVRLAALAIVLLLLALTAEGQTTAKYQSSARPFGLDIVDTVSEGRSDAASADFFNNALPGLSDYLDSSLSEQVAVTDFSSLLDQNKLTLQNEYDARVYFIGEGAGYQNTLGFNTSGTGIDSGNPQLIFPDASSKYYGYSSKLENSKIKRNAKSPIAPGDFVDLGTLSAGTTLDFFLIADGANGGKNVYSTDESSNPDGVANALSFAYTVPGSSYLVIGFEDLYVGGDRDYNDLLFAIDIGAANLAALTATPEPATLLSIGSLLGIVGFAKRRRAKPDDSQDSVAA
jgi:hypothetical protein